MNWVSDGKIMPLSEEVSRTHAEYDVFDLPSRRKACREKSAEVIVPKARVPIGKD